MLKITLIGQSAAKKTLINLALTTCRKSDIIIFQGLRFRDYP